jgi:hypothetical protein
VEPLPTARACAGTKDLSIGVGKWRATKKSETDHRRDIDLYLARDRVEITATTPRFRVKNTNPTALRSAHLPANHVYFVKNIP